MPSKTSVLVVGDDPVGLAFAGDLGWRWIGRRIVEKGKPMFGRPLPPL